MCIGILRVITGWEMAASSPPNQALLSDATQEDVKDTGRADDETGSYHHHGFHSDEGHSLESRNYWTAAHTGDSHRVYIRTTYPEDENDVGEDAHTDSGDAFLYRAPYVSPEDTEHVSTPQKGTSFDSQKSCARTCCCLHESSVIGFVRNAERIAQRLGFLVDEQKDKTQTQVCIRVIVYASILIFGAALYRVLGCNHWDFGCRHKTIGDGWNDWPMIAIFGGAIYATGPTLSQGLWLSNLASFFLSLFGFGLFGEASFLQNNLSGSDWYMFPAILVYALGFMALLVLVAYSMLMAPSKQYRRANYILLVLVTIYFGLGYVVTNYLLEHALNHIHHYQLAFVFLLFLRHPEDSVSVILRWAVTGVFIQGISAYGFDNTILQYRFPKSFPIET